MPFPPRIKGYLIHLLLQSVIYLKHKLGFYKLWRIVKFLEFNNKIKFLITKTLHINMILPLGCNLQKRAPTKSMKMYVHTHSQIHTNYWRIKCFEKAKKKQTKNTFKHFKPSVYKLFFRFSAPGPLTHI